MELENIKTQTTWSEAAESINSNNLKIITEVTKLQGSTYKNKGYFKTLSDLQAAFPTAAVGSKAYVGLSYPYAIYLWENNSWVDSGATGGEESVKLDQFYTKDETDSQISALEKETGTKLIELSEEAKKVSGVYTLDFEVTQKGVDPNHVYLQPSPSETTYLIVQDKDHSIQYLYIYGYTEDGVEEMIVDAGPANYLYKFNGEKYARIGVYVDPDRVNNSSIATLQIMIGNAAKIELVQNEGNVYEMKGIQQTISKDGYYISKNLQMLVWDAYAIYTPFFLRKGDKMLYQATTTSAVAQLCECDENGSLIEVLKMGSNERPYYYDFIASKDMYVCLCAMKSYVIDVVIQRSIPSEIDYVEEKLSKKIEELGGESVLQERAIYNLCDISKVKEGAYIKYNGEEGSSNEHCASDYIPVVLGGVYSMPVDSLYLGEANASRIACYNNKKEFVEQVVGTTVDFICTIQINNPSVAFIRTTIRKVQNYRYSWRQNFDTYMVVNSDTYPNRYIPYGDTFYYADYELAPQKAELFNPLFGKSVVFDGDSICNAGSEGTSLGWAGRIGRKNMMLWQNYAIGGGTITSISGKHIISTQSYDNANPDYIIIEGGTNDADVIGSILNGQTPAAYGSYEPNKYDGDYDNTTFCGAIEFLFKRLLTTYPSAKIGVIIAPKMGVLPSYTKEGNNRRAYFETLMQLCKKWGIPYLNLWDRGRLNPALSVYYNDGEDSFYTDGQHLTSKGYDVITPMIEAWMKTL